MIQGPVCYERLFRFEDLEIWRRASDLGYRIDCAAEVLDRKRRYKYAEQLRAAGLSISNNVAEGSGSSSSRDFCKFLNYARRSAFECANMLLLFERQRLLSSECVRPLLLELNEECRMMLAFARSLSRTK